MKIQMGSVPILEGAGASPFKSTVSKFSVNAPANAPAHAQWKRAFRHVSKSDYFRDDKVRACAIGHTVHYNCQTMHLNLHK